jgi:serine/threonine protein kinase
VSGATPSIAGFSDLRPIGRGGFSVVYEAVQDDLGRKVAVKVLNLDLSTEDAKRRFERECRAIGALSGVPGIVGVHQGAVTDDGRMAIVMELMAAGTLDDRVRNQGHLPPSRPARWLSTLPPPSERPMKPASRTATSSRETS